MKGVTFSDSQSLARARANLIAIYEGRSGLTLGTQMAASAIGRLQRRIEELEQTLKGHGANND